MGSPTTIPTDRSAPANSIPFDQFGAETQKRFRDGSAITPTARGARLRAVMQDLEGEATDDGLWLTSTADEDAGRPNRFRVKATAVSVGGQHASAMSDQTVGLASTGKVRSTKEQVAFVRPGVVEEYSVSVDGVRQDYVVLNRPTGGGQLSVALDITGARAESADYGAKLTIVATGRELAYSRLKVTDAAGRELQAKMNVEASDRLRIEVEDADAVYPVRIDPTFSDADWISMNPSISGASSSVSALVVDGSGNLFIGGSFAVVGTVAATRIAKWNGSAWSALGSGMDGHVQALAVSGNDLYAGGYFTTAGGVSARRIAKWNGSAWSALGSGMISPVYALAVSGSDLYAAGNFTTAGGVSANYVAKWNGSAWSALSTGMNSDVKALAVSGSDLYAGGYFTTAGGGSASRVAKWNGSAWSALGSGMNTDVQVLAVSGSDLYAGGFFNSAGGVSAKSVAKWNGSAWSALGSGMVGSIAALAVSGSDLYAAGNFTTAGGVSANCIAKWNGSTWSALGLGMNSEVYELVVSGSDLYAAGNFTTAGGVSANRIARWNGSVWSALGSGIDGLVQALAVSGSDLYAGGGFTTAGGKISLYFARADLSPFFATLALGAASSVTATSATLNGTVNPNGLLTAAQFEYGPTTAYGSLAAASLSPNNGTLDQAVNVPLTGLTPGTLYHYRLTATTSSGTKVTGDGTFTTAPAPEIRVFAGSNDTAPELTDGQSVAVDFGGTPLGTPVTRSFTVKNTGTASLHVSGVTLPAMYECVGSPFPCNLGPNASVTFQVRFLANTVKGVFGGWLALSNDDSDEAVFDFTVAATALRNGPDAGLDLSFGTGGTIITPAGTSSFVSSIVVQPDGKIVAAGRASDGTKTNFAIVRYLPSGTLDQSFGSGGVVTVAIGVGDSSANSVALQRDGKIVAGGYATNASEWKFALVRLNSNGVLDTSFGGGGTIMTKISTTEQDVCEGVAIQSDGKIVAVGRNVYGLYHVQVVRYDQAGNLDTSFNGNGKVRTFVGGAAHGYAVAFQGDGKILVTGGYSNNSQSPSYNNVVLLRYTAAGALDTGFGSGGIVTTAVKNSDRGQSVALQGDGKIIVGGLANDDWALLRYLPSGQFDASFGVNGIVTTDFGSNTRDFAYSVAIRSDGRIILAGMSDFNSGAYSVYDFAVARYLLNGDLDTSFGNTGKVTTHLSSDTDGGRSVALQPDGRIVVGGYSQVGGTTQVALVRYGADLAPIGTTIAGTSVAGATATLNGTVNPNGVITHAWFEYGTTTSYGQTTASQAQGFGPSASPVSAAISGLTPATTYHYRLVAQNGETTAYGGDMTFTTPSSNANLANFALSAGTLTPAFASGTTSYTASVSNATTSITVTPTVADATATVKVNNVAVASGSASGAINLSVGNNVISTVVSAQDGTPRTYTLTVTRAASSNADLASLVPSAGTLTPAFASGTTSYIASVSNATTSITVTPTVADATATVKVNNVAVASGSASGAINLSVGNNVISTVVSAQDGTPRTYTLTVNRAQSSNANLANLVPSPGTLTPVFASGTTSYTASVSNATTSITMTPTVADATATVKINNVAVVSGSASGSISLSVGNNVINTEVTAQDGTPKTYTLTVSRAASSNADLVNLVPSTGTLTPAFESGITNYAVSVPNATTSLSVTPTVAHANATVKVNNVAVASGSASGPISLNVGNNVVAIAVTAQDGTPKNYSLTVTRAAVIAVFNAPDDVPITASNYTAAGNTIEFELNCSPPDRLPVDGREEYRVALHQRRF
ncbi:hypothetical protein AYO49_00600 [Verrucomicrobiaceae bacterium SCGC AG-212-N21]|nr:hypothetical protein AYO49_00600 [Verrucomicrobiaceae bacterium SCGC AG-212-N21]